MTHRFLTTTLAPAIAALTLGMSGAAQAETMELTFIGTAVSGDIFAQTSGTNVTAIWGAVTDADLGPGSFTITGLSGYAGADNTLGLGSPRLTLGGLSFSTAGGGDFNLADLDGYGSYSGYAFLSSTLNPGGGFSSVGMTAVSLEVTAVPEPATLGMMLAGAVAMFSLARRRIPAR